MKISFFSVSPEVCTHNLQALTWTWKDFVNENNCRCVFNEIAPVHLGFFNWEIFVCWLKARSQFLAYSGIGIVGISQIIVRSRATLIPEWLQNLHSNTVNWFWHVCNQLRPEKEELFWSFQLFLFRNRPKRMHPKRLKYRWYVTCWLDPWALECPLDPRALRAIWLSSETTLRTLWRILIQMHQLFQKDAFGRAPF